MRRIALPLAVACVAAAPSTAAAADLTPDGPATLMNRWSGASTLEGRPPEVLVAATVVVGEGGRGGTIRVRAAYGGVTRTGDPVELPAAPGTYTFPAPHIRWDYRGGRVGIEQTAGGHAIVNRLECRPELGEWADLCQLSWLDIFDGDTLRESRGGTPLAMTGLFEIDRDEDLLGDKTEDRTDLRVAATTRRDSVGRPRVEVTVSNAGPLAADRPYLEISGLAGTWSSGCTRPLDWFWPSLNACHADPIAVGASRTLTFTPEPHAAGTLRITAGAEGPDLADADNTAAVNVVAAPELALAASKPRSLRNGIKVRVTAARTGSARLVVRFRGSPVALARTVRLKAFTPRTITVRPHGAKLRRLRTAAPTRATVTVRRAGGNATASVTTSVR